MRAVAESTGQGVDRSLPGALAGRTGKEARQRGAERDEEGELEGHGADVQRRSEREASSFPIREFSFFHCSRFERRAGLTIAIVD